jgi:hypothetical protein
MGSLIIGINLAALIINSQFIFNLDGLIVLGSLETDILGFGSLVTFLYFVLEYYGYSLSGLTGHFDRFYVLRFILVIDEKVSDISAAHLLCIFITLPNRILINSPCLLKVFDYIFIPIFFTVMIKPIKLILVVEPHIHINFHLIITRSKHPTHIL